MVAGGRRWRRSGFSRGCGGWRRGGLPRGAKILTGMYRVLRIRVADDYRVLYTVDDDRLVVLVVA
jgi:mRNA-degrading endonuclease RelE of RelBE toxin-antitoxin system